MTTEAGAAAVETPNGEGYAPSDAINPAAERAFLVFMLERAIKTIYYCTAHDRSKTPAINQAMNGKMPRFGTRFLTPKEAGLRFIKELRTTTKEKKRHDTDANLGTITEPDAGRNEDLDRVDGPEEPQAKENPPE
jgi:hypothetical protein